MASLSPPSTTTTTTTIASLSNPLLLKTSQVSALKRRNHRLTPRLSRQPTQNKVSENNSSNPTPPIPDHGKLDRRNMLMIGLGGAATTLGGATLPSAVAAPAIPDVKNCYLTSTSGGGPEGLECCPPVFNNIVDFDFKNYPILQQRVRRPAHEVSNDPVYMFKFKEAVRKMRALPRSDPRNFTQQANVHCAYCDGAYRQEGFPNIDLLVHGSWLFFPMHRMYLYFFERILGKLIDDPGFALPYWNWDHPDGMRMPTIYTNPDSPLFDALRDPYHQPPKVLDLMYNKVDYDIPESQQIDYNLLTMYIQMVRNKKPELFMGAPLYAGIPTDDQLGTGALEAVPHNAIHVWTGDRNDEPFNRDMGSYFSAAKDPIFYGLHANVDRMWAIWNNNLGAVRPDFTSRDWLNTAFVFYDENAKAVRIKTSDVLDISKLGYSYAEQDLPWLTIDLSKYPKPPRPNPPPTPVQFPIPLSSVIQTRVSRPKSGRTKAEEEVATEVLTIKVNLVKEDEYVKFDVFIDDGRDFENIKNSAVAITYAGSYTHLPHKTRKGAVMVMNSRLRLPIAEILEGLDAQYDEYVDVALVPRSGKDCVVINSVAIEYVT